MAVPGKKTVNNVCMSDTIRKGCECHYNGLLANSLDFT